MGQKKFVHPNGQLNHTVTKVAENFLRDLGHDIKIVRTDNQYNIKDELQKFLLADIIIWQMPGWWRMDAPWTVKKYMDEILPKGKVYCMPAMCSR